jgi:hypothetical protein
VIPVEIIGGFRWHYNKTNFHNGFFFYLMPDHKRIINSFKDRLLTETKLSWILLEENNVDRAKGISTAESGMQAALHALGP